MYAVVGCSECEALWLVGGRPETTRCPRCGRRHRYAKLKKFVSTGDRDRARQVRATLLADRQGHGDAFSDLDSVAEMEAAVDDAGVDDAEYLAGAGIDAEEVAAAEERAGRGTGAGGQSRKETVVAALRDLDSPTADEVEAYAVERGVPADYAARALEKLVRAGDVSESGGRYRLL